MYSIVKVIVNAIAVTLDYTIDLLLLNVFMLLLLISTEIKSCFFFIYDVVCVCLSTKYKMTFSPKNKKTKIKAVNGTRVYDLMT